MVKEIKKILQGIDLTERFSTLVKYRIPTGIIAIDTVTHGIPSGKITEIYGGWSAGKTRLILHIIVQTLKLGGYAVLVDNERALEAGLCDLVGLDVAHSKFIYVNPDIIETVEDVFEFIENTIDVVREKDSDGFLSIFWDSLAATPTEEEMTKKFGEDTNIAAARRAKLIGQGIRRLSSKMFKTHSCLVIVNQIRDRFDVQFGDKTSTPGGKAVKFHSSLRIKLQLIKRISDKKTREQIGNEVKLVVEKSRIGFPFGVVNFEMLVAEPINKYAGLLDYMIRHGEIIHPEKSKKYWFKGESEEKSFEKKDFIKEYEKWKGALK